MTYRELYELGCQNLTSRDVPEAGLDARLLLEYVCGTDRNALLVHGDKVVAPQEEEKYLKLVAKRGERIPLQHLTEVQEFMGLDFRVNEHVLIPRQDTEILVEEVLKNSFSGMRVLDMCTGSGCILISLLRYVMNAQGVGADLSEEALLVARENAVQLLGADHVLDEMPKMDGDGCFVTFVQSDLFQNVQGIYDVIVSNPPYIKSEVINGLMPEVRDHEPRMALDGSEDGLLFYRVITQESKKHLNGGGMLFYEIGYDQGEAVREIMEQAGFIEVQVVKDYSGFDRVVYGTLQFSFL